MRTALRIFLLAACATAAFADKVVLKDGRSFEGEIVEETAEQVKIKTARSALTFKMEEVDHIERGMSPLQERNKRLEALDGEDGGAYLELAKWMATAPKEVQDEKVLRRLCSAAAYLDPETAAAAQNLIGAWLLAAGKREDAADAFARVLKADPANEEAKKHLETLNSEIVARCRKDLDALKAAIEKARDLQYAAAIPLLRKAGKLYVADKCRDFVKLSIEELADDCQRRIPCPTCKGATTRQCTICKGKGTTECVQCKGTGVRKSAPPNPTFAQEICSHCYHTGALLCTGCDAERWLTIHYQTEVKGKKNVDVKVSAGVEKVELSKVVSLSKWTSRDGNVKVTALTAGQVVKGGTFTCRDCKGIKFDPPSEQPNTFGMADYLKAIEARMSGGETIEGVPVPETVWDPAELEGGKLKWKAGKWE
ncbi:MAG: hypothetical protein IT452_16020 [Planctomycetia bacterium]|nr:hypothetical protein [Planctomycetia bacterium]